MTATLVATPVLRPNGKPYLRRKPPAVVEIEHSGGEVYCIVVRTHDIAEAEALVPADMREGCEPRLTWLRETICMCGGAHDRDYSHDDARGVPCVAFEY